MIRNKFVAIALLVLGASCFPATAQPQASEEEQLLAYLKTNAPLVLAELDQAKAANPDDYKSKLRLMRPMHKDEAFRKVFFHSLEQDLQVKLLAAKLRASGPAQAGNVKAELRAALARQFDAKMDAQVVEIGKVAERLAIQKKEIAAKRLRKNELVQKRFAAIIAAQDSGDW